MSNTTTALNTVSGQVGVVPKSYLDHPVLGKTLVEVPEGTKSYDPEFYTPTDAEGHAAKPVRRNKKTDKPAEDHPPVLDGLEEPTSEA